MKGATALTSDNATEFGRSYLALVGRAALLGLLSGIFAVAYLALVDGVTEALWGESEGSDWFSGSWRTLVIPVVAGLAIGLIYRALRLPPRFKGFIDELEEGEVEPSTAPGAVLVAIVSLVGGASLGPEAPLGTGAGAVGTWLARRRRDDEEVTRTLTFSGMSGAFGGLLSSPLAGPLLAFELEHHQTRAYYARHLIPGVVAGAVGFGVVWPIIGAPFLSLYSMEAEPFQSWMLLLAVGIGLAGAATALAMGQVLTGVVAMMRRLDDRPVLRGGLAGTGIALTGFALPLTLFSGQAGLAGVLEDPAGIGVVMLLALLVVKTLALGLSIGGGFYGGPIFPVFFIGGVLGALIHVLVPGVPLGLAVGGAMASLGAAAALIPLSITIFASLVVGADFLTAGAILVSACVGFVVRHMATQRQSRAPVQEAASR